MKYFKLKNFFIAILSFVVFFSVTSAIIAHADYDDEGGEIDDDQYGNVVQQVTPQIISQPTTTSKPKTVQKTIIDPPTTVVVNELKNVELVDSDHDGLVDSEDPHPNTPEIYFVKDDNRNGIVDTFENYVQQ